MAAMTAVPMVSTAMHVCHTSQCGNSCSVRQTGSSDFNPPVESSVGCCYGMFDTQMTMQEVASIMICSMPGVLRDGHALGLSRSHLTMRSSMASTVKKQKK